MHLPKSITLLNFVHSCDAPLEADAFISQENTLKSPHASIPDSPSDPDLYQQVSDIACPKPITIKGYSYIIKMEGQIHYYPHVALCLMQDGSAKMLVGAIGFEPTTPTMSRWCSRPAELRACVEEDGS